jgi:hypothetical protein
VFAAAIHLHSSLILVGKAGAYQSGAPYGAHFNDRLPAITLGWKLMSAVNTLAYYDTAE